MARNARCGQAGCNFCDPEDVIATFTSRNLRMYAPHFTTTHPIVSLHTLLQEVFLTEDDLDKVICLEKGATAQLCDGFSITRTN